MEAWKTTMMVFDPQIRIPLTVENRRWGFPWLVVSLDLASSPSLLCVAADGGFAVELVEIEASYSTDVLGTS